MMEYLWYALTFSVTFVACIAHWVYSRRQSKFNGKLPPGSMGLPILGETIQFFTPYATPDISPFIRRRMNRYGPLFRTSLVGWPVVVSTDPDVSRFILKQEGKLVNCWYTESFDNVVGRQSLVSAQGAMHKCLRNLILNQFGTESLKSSFLIHVEELVLKHLTLWSKSTSVELKEAIASMIFDFTAKKLLGYDESKTPEKLRQNYAAFLDGLISFPLKIPGTSYWKCLQGRKRAMKTIRNMLEERQASPEREDKDYIDFVLEEMQKNGTILTQEMILDLLFVLPFATYETTSSALVLAIQYLGNHPLALAEITKEHESILRSRERWDSGITWKEHKSMTFTMMAINETLRLGNIVPGIFRKVAKDIEIKGHTIPSGWMVMISPSAVHLNSTLYQDPLVFDPWRWQGQELNEGSRNFMGFGGGIRLCAGAEFVKLVMAIFLHHLLTKYRWTVIKGGDTVWQPGLVFPKGFHVQLSEENKFHEDNIPVNMNVE